MLPSLLPLSPEATREPHSAGYADAAAHAQPRRTWDAQFWTCVTKGVFPLQERIPDVLRQIGLT